MLIEDKYFVAYNKETKEIVSPYDYKQLQTVNVYPSEDIEVEVFDNVFDVVEFVKNNDLEYADTTED